MTERIDHAAEAVTYYHYASANEIRDNPELAKLSMAQAQVHATLALVEQQRIANLMKYSEWLEDRRASRMDNSLVDEIEKSIGV